MKIKVIREITFECEEEALPALKNQLALSAKDGVFDIGGNRDGHLTMKIVTTFAERIYSSEIGTKWKGPYPRGEKE